VEQFSAWSGTEGIQTLPQSALKLVGTHPQETTPSRRPTGRWPGEREVACSSGCSESSGGGRSEAVPQTCRRSIDSDRYGLIPEWLVLPP
jgi:hypothetical protein